VPDRGPSLPPPSLSALVITKNEAHRLPRCVASLVGVVDEIVVVDTGSTDDTVAVAANLGCRVAHEPWNDSFADARNASLHHVRTS